MKGFRKALPALLFVLVLTLAAAAQSVPLALPAGPVAIEYGQPTLVPVTYDPGAHLTISCDPAVFDVAGAPGGLQITAKAMGTHALSVTSTGENLPTETGTLTFVVTEPSVQLGLPTFLSFAENSTRQIPVQVSPADATVAVSAAGNVAAQYDNGVLTVTAGAVGSGSVTVTAARPGCKTTTAVIPVTVSVSAVDTTTYAGTVDSIVRMVNNRRAEAGLAALTHLEIVDVPATIRAQEVSKFWSHTRPDGRSFDTVLTECGMSYRGKGENLFAANVLDASEAMTNWMNSPDHRENILRPAFTGIGVGIVRGSDGDYYYSQIFVHD